VGVAGFAGADFRPAFTLPLDRRNLVSLKIGANYQFQYSWLLTGGVDYSDANRIPYMPMHIIGGTLELAWKTGSLFVSAHYESARYGDVTNKMALEPHCIAHATLNQKMGKHFTFFASLRNILNEHYESFASYYMPGISLVCGTRFRYN
jgi:outer membrane receptor protein involved in Fe transport